MASVSPLGSFIYTNQASPLVTQMHQPTQHRPDMIQFSLNQTIIEKEQEVERVTQPTNDRGIDPDKDNGQDNSGMYNAKKRNKEEQESDDAEDAEPSVVELNHLDIKV